MTRQHEQTPTSLPPVGPGAEAGARGRIDEIGRRGAQGSSRRIVIRIVTRYGDAALWNNALQIPGPKESFQESLHAQELRAACRRRFWVGSSDVHGSCACRRGRRRHNIGAAISRNLIDQTTGSDSRQAIHDEGMPATPTRSATIPPTMAQSVSRSPPALTASHIAPG